eukprot:scaffold858_cov16-Tisochrysis_lutea.AAC.1
MAYALNLNYVGNTSVKWTETLIYLSCIDCIKELSKASKNASETEGEIPLLLMRNGTYHENARIQRMSFSHDYLEIGCHCAAFPCSEKDFGKNWGNYKENFSHMKTRLPRGGLLEKSSACEPHRVAF